MNIVLIIAIVLLLLGFAGCVTCSTTEMFAVDKATFDSPKDGAVFCTAKTMNDKTSLGECHHRGVKTSSTSLNNPAFSIRIAPKHSVNLYTGKKCTVAGAKYDNSKNASPMTVTLTTGANCALTKFGKPL